MDIKCSITGIKRNKDKELTELKRIQEKLNNLPTAPYSTLRKVETAIKHIQEIDIEELERGFING